MIVKKGTKKTTTEIQNSANVVEPWYNCINGRRFSTVACASAWNASITTYS